MNELGYVMWEYGVTFPTSKEKLQLFECTKVNSTTKSKETLFEGESIHDYEIRILALFVIELYKVLIPPISAWMIFRDWKLV